MDNSNFMQMKESRDNFKQTSFFALSIFKISGFKIFYNLILRDFYDLGALALNLKNTRNILQNSLHTWE